MDRQGIRAGKAGRAGKLGRAGTGRGKDGRRGSHGHVRVGGLVVLDAWHEEKTNVAALQLY